MTTRNAPVHEPISVRALGRGGDAAELRNEMNRNLAALRAELAELRHEVWERSSALDARIDALGARIDAHVDRHAR